MKLTALAVVILALGIVVGFQSLQKLRIIEELRARHPTEPWLADFTWDQQRASEDTQKQRKQAFRNGISCFAALIIIGVMLVAKFGIQNLAKWPREQIVNSSIVVIALTAFVVIGFWQLGKAAYLAARMAKYGQSE
ncbi:MAG: hypothetical protein IID46_15905 [Planctomycetes bacterium]|nr:hypothetical protein [Planctomycetota bacterium]